MHDVSNAINILDPSKTIDGKICKEQASTNADEDNKCTKGSTGDTGLAGTMNVKNNSSLFNSNDKLLSAVPKTAAKISTDVSALNREQKGVVSSAFAKAHEGAEIVEIRSISTTSVMVNACYDVLTDGLPVHFLLGIT